MTQTVGQLRGMEEKITDQYNGLVNISENLLEKLEQYVEDHQIFQDTFRKTEDWIQNLEGKRVEMAT